MIGMEPGHHGSSKQPVDSLFERFRDTLRETQYWSYRPTTR